MANRGIEKLREHNLSLIANNGAGPLNAVDVRDTVQEALPSFAKEVSNLRRGKAVDARGNEIGPVDISFEDALKLHFNTDAKTLMAQLGVHSKSMSLEQTARTLGCDNFTLNSMEELMVSASNFDSVLGTPASTTQVDSDYRFLIPELIGAAIRTGYINSALHPNWIAATQNMSKRKITMPHIKRGDGMPSKIAEGANIPMGSVQFGQKEAGVFKIGTGFKLTDELIAESALDVLFIFLQEVGNDMSIGADVLALNVLLQGEQISGSESAPVVGVATPGTLAYTDIKKVFTRMTRLNQPASRIITSENDAINITGIDKFEGFQGDTKLASIKTIVGVPEKFDIDVHVPPASQMIFLDPTRAMMKLNFRGMVTERRRNPQNQTEELFISDHIGFAIIKRDARVVLDKSVSIGSSPFPSYMDIDSRIQEAFKNL